MQIMAMSSPSPKIEPQLIFITFLFVFLILNSDNVNNNIISIIYNRICVYTCALLLYI
jgi:hypothetical protein